MLLYIHGFGSCGSGNKIDALVGEFGREQVLSPDLPPSPRQSMELLEQLVSQHNPDLLVGSSLGGFYAEWLNGRYRIPSVLINPSTQPQVTLARYLGSQTHWCSGESFDWTQEHINEIQYFIRDRPMSDEHYLVLLQTADEVLDFRLAAERFDDHEVLIEDGGNHRFENLADYTTRIADFRKRANSHQ